MNRPGARPDPRPTNPSVIMVRSGAPRFPFRTMINFVALGAAGCLLLSGCQTDPGAAAVVGGVAISRDTVAKDAQRALGNRSFALATTDRASYQRTLLERLITYRLVDRLAARVHVQVSKADIDNQIATAASQAGGTKQLYQQAAAAGFPRQDVRPYLRYQLLRTAIQNLLVDRVTSNQDTLRRLYDDNQSQFNQVHLADIAVQTKTQADRILAQVRAKPSTFASLAKTQSLDTQTAPSGGDVGFVSGTQIQSLGPQAVAQLLAAKPNSFLEVAAPQGGGFYVFHIIAQRHLSFEAAIPHLKQLVTQQQGTKLLTAAIADEARRVGVHVNPRFGRWDANQAAVAAPPNLLSSPAPRK